MRPRAPSGFSNYKRIKKMLVGAVGIEPTTFGLKEKRYNSSNLLTARGLQLKISRIRMALKGVNGRQTGVETDAEISYTVLSAMNVESSGKF
jgi:hypothetical protein